MSASGLTIEDYETDAVEIWPENWRSWTLFASVRTQWRYSFNGRSGLAYEAIYPLMDRMGLSPEEWDQTFDDLQEMEQAALSAMHSN